MRFVRATAVCESTPGIWGAPQTFVETLPAVVRTSRGLRVPLRFEGCPAAAAWAPRARSAPGAAPERSRKGRGSRAGWGPWAPGLGGQPAWAARGWRAALLPSARRGGAAPRPLWLWRGGEVWAASPSCSWRPSRRRRLPRTRRSCLNHRSRAHPAAHVRRPLRRSSSPSRPQLSAGAFGFSAASRILAARRGLGKCVPAAVGSNLP